MGFRIGDLIEVSSKEEGFVGSYFAARIVKDKEIEQGVKNNKYYLVEYMSLLTDDEKHLLREMVDVDEVRPLPPNNFQVAAAAAAANFKWGDRVDAFDNDGWWVGEIKGIDQTGFFVYFDTYQCCIPYGISQLRRHLDWQNGEWVVPFSQIPKKTVVSRRNS